MHSEEQRESTEQEEEEPKKSNWADGLYGLTQG